MEPVRLVLLPGLGADARMFGPQKAAFPHLETPDWLEPLPRESLAAYGRRFAETIGPAGPLVLGGASFGGMVALEAARWLRSRAVVLIGSCRDPRSVGRLWRWAEWVSRLLPAPPRAGVRVLAPASIDILGPLMPDARATLLAMAAEAPIPRVRWGARALLEWSGAADLEAPVRHIHGALDRIIPAAAVAPDELVPGAGHIPSMTHPAAVNTFLARCLDCARTSEAERGR